MNMKKMLAVVAAASLVAIAAPAFAANPFSDVPMNHWAYDAVEELSAKGVLEGYPNGTFKGNRAMTRYEIAVMVGRMLANGGVSGEDLEKLKALVVEFRPELEALGVKVDGFDSRISALEEGVGGWKLSGQFRMDYKAYDKDFSIDKDGKKKPVHDGSNISRTRFFMHKDLNDGLSMDIRYNEDKFDRWYLTARDFFDIEGLTAKAGHFEIDWMDDDGLELDDDAVFGDFPYRAYDLNYTYSMFELEAFAASKADGEVYDDIDGEYYGLRAKANFTENLWMSANANWKNNFDDNTKLANYWISAGFNFMDGVEVHGSYFMNDIDRLNGKTVKEDDGKAYQLGFSIDQDVLNFTGLTVEYSNFDEGFVPDHMPYARMAELIHDDAMVDGALVKETKGWFVQADQKWNDKWSTFEAFRMYSMDNVADTLNDDASSWNIGAKYNYNPNLYFQLEYEDADAPLYSPKTEDGDKIVRFRTFLSF